MKIHIYADALSVIGHEGFEKRPQIRRPINDHRGGFASQSQSRQQRKQSEQVITMDMRNEYGIQFGDRHLVSQHLALHGFTAVYQKQTPMYLQYMSALKSINNRHR